MQNEQGGIVFIYNNGYTKGRGRQTVHTTEQGTQLENRMVGERGGGGGGGGGGGVVVQTLRQTGTR